MICYHHNDLDGKSAGFLVHKLKPSGIEDSLDSYVMTTYDDMMDKHTAKDDVFIVDISISEKTYPMLLNVCKTARSVTWIDHHATSEAVAAHHKDELQKIPNLTYFVSTCACGAALTYAFFHIDRNEFYKIRKISDDEMYDIDATYDVGKIKIVTSKFNKKNPTDSLWFEYNIVLPQWLYHVDDYDCWKHLDPNTDNFALGTDSINTSLVIFNPKLGYKVFNRFWEDLYNDAGAVARYIADGKIISCYVHSRYYRELMKTFEWKFNGVTFICKNATGNSWNFEDFIDKYKAAILFNYDGKSGLWQYSIYSSDSSDFDCEKFAKRFGGGGHLHASGFSTRMLMFTNPPTREEKEDIIFLGGTCNGSDWREEFISIFNKTDCKTQLFNPVVKDWTPECKDKEDEIKHNARMNLFVITPEMTGIYSIAEAVECSHYNGSKVFFAIINRNGTFTDGNIKSFDAIGDIIKDHGGVYKNYTNYSYDKTIETLVNDVIAAL